MPAIEVTMPSGAPAAASVGPCSMCASTKHAGGGSSQPARRQLAVAERGERLGQRDAVGVDAGRPRRRRASPQTARLPKQPRPKRGPSSSRNAMTASVRRGGPSRAIASAASSASEHAERAVEAPAVGRRVEVRAAPDLGQLGLAAGEPADEVAGRVELDLEPRLAHPARTSSNARCSPSPGRAGSCRPRGRSRRACRAARGCARRATPGWRFGTPPESARAGCSRARVCQGEGDSHANGERAGAWRASTARRSRGFPVSRHPPGARGRRRRRCAARTPSGAPRRRSMCSASGDLPDLLRPARDS